MFKCQNIDQLDINSFRQNEIQMSNGKNQDEQQSSNGNQTNEGMPVILDDPSEIAGGPVLSVNGFTSEEDFVSLILGFIFIVVLIICVVALIYNDPKTEKSCSDNV